MFKTLSKIALMLLLVFPIVSTGASLLIQKHAGVLTVTGKKETVSVAVLYGKNTPVGKFKIEKKFSTKLNNIVLVFSETPEVALAIHPLWMGNPKQHRVNRLKSLTPSDNMITQGCINVDPTIFYSVLILLENGTELEIIE